MSRSKQEKVLKRLVVMYTTQIFISIGSQSQQPLALRQYRED